MLKKILVLSFYYQPDLCAGSFRCTALVNELIKLPDLAVTVLTTAPNRYASFSEDAPAFEQQGNLQIHRCALPRHKSGIFDQIKSFISFYLQARRLTKTQHYDVVVATSSRLFTAFLGARVAKKQAAPLYLDIRDIFLDTINDVFSSKKLLLTKPIVAAVEKYTFGAAQRINLVSEGFSNYFANRYPQADYRFYTNGIDDTFATPLTQLAQTTPALPLRVLYAGNIGEGQGMHHILPELAKLLPNVNFRIIGDGGRRLLLKQQLQRLPNVEMLPPVNRQQLLAEYQKADVLFLHLNDLPAFEKVLPSKIFEYAATGKPILAGVAGYAAEFIRREVPNAAVFAPGNHDSAKLAFDSLALTQVDRSVFVSKYLRRSIMQRMAQDIHQFSQASAPQAE